MSSQPTVHGPQSTGHSPQPPVQGPKPKAKSRRPDAEDPGFTLIELMVVVSIMAIILAMGIPSILRVIRRDAMTKAVNDIQEVCSHARARAILQGTMTEVIFHGGEEQERLEVAGAAGSRGGSGLSAEIPKKIGIATLRINGLSYMDASIARVRFYPNGTCDDLRMILLSDEGEFRGIFLEITTGLATVESDRFKLQSEIK